MKLIEELFATGHRNITARHPTTFEITTEPHVTPRGDCVIGVNANKGPLNLSTAFRDLCRRDDCRILVELHVAGISESIKGKGSSKLTLKHPTEFVGRKTTYTSDRTLMINADKAAGDLSRELAAALASPETRLRVRIIAET